MLVLDSGAVTGLAERSGRAAALIAAFRREGLWPPVVPSVVLVECLTGMGRGTPGSTVSCARVMCGRACRCRWRAGRRGCDPPRLLRRRQRLGR